MKKIIRTSIIATSCLLALTTIHSANAGLEDVSSLWTTNGSGLSSPISKTIDGKHMLCVSGRTGNDSNFWSLLLRTKNYIHNMQDGAKYTISADLYTISGYHGGIGIAMTPPPYTPWGTGRYYFQPSYNGTSVTTPVFNGPLGFSKGADLVFSLADNSIGYDHDFEVCVDNVKLNKK